MHSPTAASTESPTEQSITNDTPTNASANTSGRSVSGSKTTTTLLVLAALVIVLAGIKAATTVIVPFLLSIFIAMTCNPLINRLMKLKIPRPIAVFVIMALIVVIGFSIAGLVGQSLNDFSRNIPVYSEKFTEQLGWVTEQLIHFNITLNKELVAQHFNPGAAMSLMADMLKGLGNVMANLFLIILTVIFMLFEAPAIPNKVHLALDDPHMKLKHIDRFLDSVNSYLVIKTLVSLATGTCVGVMLWALGVDYFVLWAVLAFMFNYIPNIGSIIAAVPAVLVALVIQGPAVAGFAAIGFAVINIVMGNVIEPRFMGKGLGLSTLVVFLSLIFWGWLLGSVGMLLSVPLTMIVKIAMEASEEGNWFAVLLGQ
ncbi:MAG: AI-2 transport protein TqsA [Phenylobacterium sp.]|jgi:AI-2 transport protein TqsA